MRTRADEFRDLALLLSDGDAALSADVELSEADPAAYVRAHATQLKSRGIKRPIDGLPWIALIAGLKRKGKLIELDWKESGEMFVDAATKLLENDGSPQQARDALSSIDAGDSREIVHVFGRINRALTPSGYCIVFIDIDSDCYPIALARTSAMNSIMEIAHRLDRRRVRAFRAPDR